MKEKLSIVLGIGIIAAVIGTFYYFILNTNAIELGELTQIAIVMILVGAAAYILWDRFKNLQKGLPAQDERLKLTNYKACYYGFIASIWSAVLYPLISGIFFDYELPGHYVTAVVVMSGGLAFMISYFYLFWRGN